MVAAVHLVPFQKMLVTFRYLPYVNVASAGPALDFAAVYDSTVGLALPPGFGYENVKDWAFPVDVRASGCRGPFVYPLREIP